MAYQAEIDKLEGRFREKPEQWFAALADAYRKSGEVDMALEVLNAWIDKRPSYTSGHIVLGRCHLDKQQDAVAAEAFEKVLELDMENVIALKSLSEIAERKGDSAGARGWLQRLLEVDPMNEEATTALERLGEGVEAAEAEEVVGAGDVEEGGEAFGLAGVADQPRDRPMPAMGFEATELQAPAEFEADSVTGFEPTGEVADEFDGVPIDGDAMLKADAIPEDVEAGVEEVPVEDVAPIADLELPIGEEPTTPSIPDTVPEGFEAIKIEPDVDFASLVREDVDEAEPPVTTRVPDTLTDETALVMGPALEAMEGVGVEGAEGAGEVDAAEVAEEPEEAGFAFGFAPEAAGLPEEDAPSDVAF
ncbi:MAG: tetratricopeptide repeat protein, partial [Gemmatimonadota bacterium]|nr:tetratricopeptide repeat protein [Gemmatimonadota bacterium]